MKYILNFDYEKIKEINKTGMIDFNNKAENRKIRADKATDAEVKKKIKAEKIDKLVLDTDDLLVLRFLYTIGNEPKTVRCKEDNNYFWVKLNSLLDEYEGLLFLTKTALNARLNKYVAMGLVERKCVKNEDGSFSFFKLTGINNLIYVENKKEVPAPVAPKYKKRKSTKKDQAEKVEVLEGQVTVEEALAEVEGKTDIEKVVDATGVTEEEARLEVEVAKTKGAKNIVNYAIGTIRNKKESDRKIEKYVSENNINPLKFNNFEPREYDYDTLERKLLGWDDGEISDEEALADHRRNNKPNYTSNNSKRFNNYGIGENVAI